MWSLCVLDLWPLFCLKTIGRQACRSASGYLSCVEHLCVCFCTGQQNTTLYWFTVRRKMSRNEVNISLKRFSLIVPACTKRAEGWERESLFVRTWQWRLGLLSFVNNNHYYVSYAVKTTSPHYLLMRRNWTSWVCELYLSPHTLPFETVCIVNRTIQINDLTKCPQNKEKYRSEWHKHILV